LGESAQADYAEAVFFENGGAVGVAGLLLGGFVVAAIDF
jgi:hypothetical protein